MHLPAQLGLKGRFAVVTGGASGIGLACTHALQAAGARVLSADRSHAPGDFDVASPIAMAHCDVADEDSVATTVARALQAWGRLDIWVNSAGVLEAVHRTVDQDLADWEQVMSINLKGTFIGCREAGRAMLAQGGGCVVNIGSVAGMVGLPGSTAYGPGKAAVATLTRNLACEWARGGVRVNCIAPGYIQTPMSRALFADDAASQEMNLRRVPMRRMGEPEDIARAILFLCSDAARYITGVTLPVDGGWSASAGSGR